MSFKFRDGPRFRGDISNGAGGKYEGDAELQCFVHNLETCSVIVSNMFPHLKQL